MVNNNFKSQFLYFYRDICPLLKNPEAFSAAIDLIVNKITTLYKQVDVIVGM